MIAIVIILVAALVAAVIALVGAMRRGVETISAQELDKTVEAAKRKAAEASADAARETAKEEGAVPSKSDDELERDMNK